MYLRICALIIGCTSHYANIGYLDNTSMVSLSMIRNPIYRAISAFFYKGHSNLSCGRYNAEHRDKCFKAYASRSIYQNIVTKMFATGEIPYSPQETCNSTEICENSLESALVNIKKLDFIGIMEMWELSLMILHHKLPFIQPLLSEFAINENPLRRNKRDRYKEFKLNATYMFREELFIQNQYDIQIYLFVVDQLCQDLLNYNLWNLEIVRDYWYIKSRQYMNIKNCSIDDYSMKL